MSDPPQQDPPNNTQIIQQTIRIPTTIRFGVTATVRATQHQIPSSRANLGGPGPPNNPNAPTNNNTGEMPGQTQNLFQMRDRLFLALFFRVSLIYARAFPRSLRRVVEFCLLMQSILLLFILGYIHVVYTRSPITCLGDVKDSWPKNGVLRVEITTAKGDYDLVKSYAKEERMRQRAAASQFGQYTDDFFSLVFTADSLFLDRVVSTAGGLLATVTGDSSKKPPEENVAPTISVESAEPPESSKTTATIDPPPDEEIVNKSVEIIEEEIAAAAGEEESNIDPSIPITASGESALVVSDSDILNPDSVYFNKTIEEIEILKLEQAMIEDDKLLNSSVTDFEMFQNSVWTLEHAYIVEYALEYGFLRLSQDTRQKLGIPVKLVILDPLKESCFGDRFSLFLLENFLGYDDILMSSIKNLAESEENKGYLRNVVTGEQFRFVPMWMARSSYIPALLIMLVFTVSISMLLRYSHHQIFVFIVDLLNNIEGAGNIHIPAAPLFTVILALVGMEAIMSEFFNDTSTAFYVILIVWIADQYDSVCSHTNITKTYWVRFFYLYHFAFYAYHYRFNGQYGGLALLVSWSFTQHSMVYFYHHYELPAILRQAYSQQQQQHNMSSPPPPENTSSMSSANTNNTTSSPTTDSLHNNHQSTANNDERESEHSNAEPNSERRSGGGSESVTNNCVVNPSPQLPPQEVRHRNINVPNNEDGGRLLAMMEDVD